MVDELARHISLGHDAFAHHLQINEVEVGRMLFVVFIDEAPIAAENFRQMFSGEMVCALSIIVLPLLSRRDSASVAGHLSLTERGASIRLCRGTCQRMAQRGKARACLTTLRGSTSTGAWSGREAVNA